MCESGSNFDGGGSAVTIRSLARRPDNGRCAAVRMPATVRDCASAFSTNGHVRPDPKAKAPLKAAGSTSALSFHFAAVWRDSEPATAAHQYVAKSSV